MSGDIDGCGQDQSPGSARFGEPGQVIVTGDDSGAMFDCSLEFLEVAGSNFLSVLLIAEHDRVVEVENDSTIVSAQKMEIQGAKSCGFEKYDEVMPASLPDQVQPLSNTRTMSASDRDLDTGRSITFDTVSQPQPSAGGTTGLDHAKDPHSSGLTRVSR